MSRRCIDAWIKEFVRKKKFEEVNNYAVYPEPIYLRIHTTTFRDAKAFDH